MRQKPGTGEMALHTGMDWAAPVGTPSIAAGGGTIEEAGVKGDYGNYVRIRHANGFQTAYGQLLKIGPDIAAGRTVDQGEKIGELGSSGLSAGPHLHFEVLVNDTHVDPLRIAMPRARELAGEALVRFNKERDRIELVLEAPPNRKAP